MIHGSLFTESHAMIAINWSRGGGIRCANSHGTSDSFPFVHEADFVAGYCVNVDVVQCMAPGERHRKVSLPVPDVSADWQWLAQHIRVKFR